MKRILVTLVALAVAPSAWSGAGGDIPVAYYSPDITRLVSGAPIFPSDAHRENELGVTLPQPAGLPAVLTNLRGAGIDALARQNGRFVFSLDVATTLGADVYLGGDVIRCENADCTSRTLLLDGAFDLPRTVNVDAVGFDPANGDMLYSIDADASYAGDAFLAADVIRWDGSDHSLELNGQRLAPGVNVDALHATDSGFSLSVDVATLVQASPTLALLLENQNVFDYNRNTQEFDFAAVGPSGDWSTANLDALHVETAAEADRLFSDGFESP